MAGELRVAIVVLADTETHADLGRLANAIEATKELHEAGDAVKMLFDGAGTKWVGVLAEPEHRLHGKFEALRPTIVGACRYCAAAFGVREAVEQSGVPLLGEYEGHPSLRTLIADGYHIITF